MYLLDGDGCNTQVSNPRLMRSQSWILSMSRVATTPKTTAKGGSLSSGEGEPLPEPRKELVGRNALSPAVLFLRLGVHLEELLELVGREHHEQVLVGLLGLGLGGRLLGAGSHALQSSIAAGCARKAFFNVAARRARIGVRVRVRVYEWQLC